MNVDEVKLTLTVLLNETVSLPCDITSDKRPAPLASTRRQKDWNENEPRSHGSRDDGNGIDFNTDTGTQEDERTSESQEGERIALWRLRGGGKTGNRRVGEGSDGKNGPTGETSVPVIFLWYKGESPEPFYSYDLRAHGKGRHWSDETKFGRRVHFSLTPAYVLTMTAVRSSDAGVYRCRVDYDRGPSKTMALNLHVVGESE
ncbi:hypothetical protein HAZT_HAZT004392 [Hyalella azteca]|uniref:Immunoglobulin domain-containing protein n=1 Tax=Hyalella azteca TaxID=294128 RepID=A0A6A0H0K4_HYAAZ|nr:hypothetical protein HAZT_HAZT004392 [Hyalella azteca]